MARSVFYSFHYDRDSWRVQQVMNIGAIGGIESQRLLNPQEWEEVEQQGDAAIEKWIASQMAYKKAVVVLVGAETAGRKWVRHEIVKAWNEKKPLVGIRIHGLADADKKTDVPGADPFAAITLKDSGRTLADFITLHDPYGATSADVHKSIASNIEGWVDNAYKRS